MPLHHSQFLSAIHSHFQDYYAEFIAVAERAVELFVAGQVEKRFQDDLLRVQLYRLAIDKSVALAKTSLGARVKDYHSWQRLRQNFIEEYGDELATTYFTSVMRKLFAEDDIPIEFEDDGLHLAPVRLDTISRHIPIGGHSQLGSALRKALEGSAFAASLAGTLPQDAEIAVDIIDEHVEDSSAISALEVLQPLFFRGKGAYIVGKLGSAAGTTPLVVSCARNHDGVKIDAVLIGYQATRSFLFSSTRSAFTVSTHHHRELCIFLHQLFPGENPAYIFDIIGFSHPAKISLLQQLRRILQTGEQFQYLGKGPIDFVFGVKGYPLVFKIIRRNVSDRRSIINNFIKLHTIDRLGQVLDSLDYRNLQFSRQQFSDDLLERLRREQPEDFNINEDEVFFRRIYGARRIIPVVEQVRTAGKKEARHLLLSVGWNIKHLAAMGFVPKSLALKHFGLTSWGRVVYLDNASLQDLRLFRFRRHHESGDEDKDTLIDPAIFERQLTVPEPHRDIFRAIHGDLFSADFWENIQAKVIAGKSPDYFPYPSRYRLKTRKFHLSVFHELQRMSGSADARQIYMGLNSLAVVDVELAGLNFLRLEVPRPSARVLVIEPIGPDIIAQLHRRFRDVTFDILNSDSEIVESAGQWTPGIHGKLQALVQVRQYDYVIGYVNETFDQDFFKLARLKGFLLLSTGTHNIDIEAATRFRTIVTNAPGPTTTTVAEQNIGLMLDGLYCHHVRYGERPAGFRWITDHDVALRPLTRAHLLWLCLLRKALRLDRMYSFGASEMYVRTGVGERATVYHDQLGQNREAGISRSIGVIGLEETGCHLIEICIAHEITVIYVLRDEFDSLAAECKKRFTELITIKKMTGGDPLDISVLPVNPAEMKENADYLVTTRQDGNPDQATDLPEGKLHIDITKIATDTRVLPAPCGDRLTLGIQGMGRIGEAVAQRALSLGMDICMYQRAPERPAYQRKQANLQKLAACHSQSTGHPLAVAYASDKEEFFQTSNIITTLAATTESTKNWVDRDGLTQLATRAACSVKVIVSAGKGLVDEEALLAFLQTHPDAEARLDILVGEHEGSAYLKLTAETVPLDNLKITGHTAAAVREVRRLKVFRALDNLRYLIDGTIPPNIINYADVRQSAGRKQSTVEIEGLKFFRMDVPSAKASVLIIEPLPPELVLHLQKEFADVSFDILLAESELVEEEGGWSPGINSRLNAIVADGRYDYCLGYCNANFDAQFFQQAKLRGLMLFSTATHHIDLEEAGRVGTVVTNSPGFTTVAVTEQNIGMVLDGLYGRFVGHRPSPGSIRLSEIDIEGDKQARAVAQILWFAVLKQALRLDDMYAFGSGDKYVRTGIRHDATVYHDQLGQYERAGIRNSIGIIGLNQVGLHLMELAMVHELSTIFVQADEFERLSRKQRNRLDDLLKLLPEVSRTSNLSISIEPVEMEELLHQATYTVKTLGCGMGSTAEKSAPVSVDANTISIHDRAVFDRCLCGLTVGVQGLGRIGEAVVQRALVLGASVVVCQRNPERSHYQEKMKRLKRLAENRATVYRAPMDIRYVDKEELFAASNVVTTLAATTSQTRHFVDRNALELLGRDAQGPVRVLVNAGKGLLNEADLASFLRQRPEVEIRLDVLTDEQVGKAGERFLDADGRPPANLKITGHTAAAVPELRRLKIVNALNNLRIHLNNGTPANILNPESAGVG